MVQEEGPGPTTKFVESPQRQGHPQDGLGSWLLFGSVDVLPQKLKAFHLPFLPLDQTCRAIFGQIFEHGYKIHFRYHPY